MSVEELLARAGAQYADDDLDGARATLEEAFAALRDVAPPAAAVVAARLGELHVGSLGNEAVGRGWLERARRLVDHAGPCVERGYVELARMACDRPDVQELERSAALALDIARAHGDVALEVRALADGGLALVTQGRVRDGFARLDEALAVLSSGEVADTYVVGTSLCSLLSSCDRAGDVERAEAAVRLVEALVLEPLGGRPKVLGTHCRLALGSVLCTVGRWTDGEATLLAALGPDASASTGHRIEAMARLAELRVHQGRIEEAAQLLATIEDAITAAAPLAMVHLRRGHADLAAAVLRAAVRRLVSDVLRGAPLVALLVEAELARGDLDAARAAGSLLRSMAVAVETSVTAALAAVADGRLARADGAPVHAVAAYDEALARLADGGHPLLAATVHLELAGAHAAAGDASAAVVAARGALAAAQRLQAAALVDQAAAVLRGLGVTPPRPAAATDALAGLTARELDVLAGIERGDSNAEIASALFLSPKTVEHHVGRLLGKLGVRTRAQAAALAARTGAE